MSSAAVSKVYGRFPGFAIISCSSCVALRFSDRRKGRSVTLVQDIDASQAANDRPPRLRMYLLGPFALTDTRFGRITPKGQKAQGNAADEAQAEEVR